MIALIPAAVVLLIVLVRVLGAWLAASTSPPASTDTSARVGCGFVELGCESTSATPHSYYMGADPGNAVDAASIARWVAPTESDRDRESMRRFYRFGL